MSKKRTRDISNDTTEMETIDSSKSPLHKCESTKLQNIAPVCILI